MLETRKIAGKPRTCARLARALGLRVRRFGSEEEGSVTLFFLVILLCMLAVVGIGIDVMRHESNRALVQSSLDRAVLASASLDQTGDAAAARAIVSDYFRKSGLPAQLSDVSAVVTLNSRRVSAAASYPMSTAFMRFLGIDQLSVRASSSAIESVQDIEILLVLDVSGSMVQNGSTRLANLQVAARDFVNTVLANDTENRISIGIVPFNGQVNLGSVLRSRYNVYDTAGVPAWAPNSNCVDLPASAYASLSLSRTTPMPATTWVESFSLANGLADANGDRVPDSVPATFSTPANSAPSAANRWCPDTAGNTLLLPTRNQTSLLAKINALQGIGATSINAGLRWGVTLLDPDSATMLSTIPGTVAGRPFAWGRANTLKVIVLMTDGEHFAEERLRDGYRSGTSPIWRSSGDGNLSIFIDRPSTNLDYWVPHTSSGAGTWQATPWNSGAGATQLTWTDVWSGNNTSGWQGVRLSWVAWQLYARGNCNGSNNTASCRLTTYTSQMNAMRSQTPTATMDTQLWDMCSRAIDQGIILYGIAFEAPANGQNAIRSCVTDRGRLAASNYFDATGLQIQTVFRTIAAQINALKLVR